MTITKTFGLAGDLVILRRSVWQFDDAGLNSHRLQAKDVGHESARGARYTFVPEPIRIPLVKKAMRFFKYIFTPNNVKYEGVRPINVYLLRVLYVLMFVGVGVPTMQMIISHQGPWDATKAVAFCVWAAYPTLGILGLLRPLKWLPIVIFMIFYKTLWVFAVAYPLWRAGTLAGNPAEETAYIFVWAPIVALFVPWMYVFKNYVMWKQPKLN